MSGTIGNIITYAPTPSQQTSLTGPLSTISCSTSYGSLLSSAHANESDIPTPTLTLSKLIHGRKYLVQIWFNSMKEEHAGLSVLLDKTISVPLSQGEGRSTRLPGLLQPGDLTIGLINGD